MSKKLISKGAEAIIYLDERKKVIIKERISKNYRVKELDIQIRKNHNKREAKILRKLSYLLINEGIKDLKVPNIFEINDFEIHMEYIEGFSLKSVIEKMSFDNKYEGILDKYLKKFAEFVAFLHKNGIIHGDLTPKNVLFNYEDKIYLIDFGLSYFSDRIEDKATDLLVFKDILNNYKFGEILFSRFLDYYFIFNHGENDLIRNKINEIEERGRYKKKKEKLLNKLKNYK